MVNNHKITCTKCGHDIDPLEIFPKGLCLECHEKQYDHQEEIQKAQKDADHLRNLFIKAIK